MAFPITARRPHIVQRPFVVDGVHAVSWHIGKRADGGAVVEYAARGADEREDRVASPASSPLSRPVGFRPPPTTTFRRALPSANKIVMTAVTFASLVAAWPDNMPRHLYVTAKESHSANRYVKVFKQMHHNFTVHVHNDSACIHALNKTNIGRSLLPMFLSTFKKIKADIWRACTNVHKGRRLRGSRYAVYGQFGVIRAGHADDAHVQPRREPNQPDSHRLRSGKRYYGATLSTKCSPSTTRVNANTGI